jgi:hypothetical protein
MIRGGSIVLLCGVLLALDLGAAQAQRRRRRRPKPPAAAKPTPAQTSAAKVEKARALKAAGSYADAIVELEAAYALTPDPELVFEIGECHRLAASRDEAIAAYRRYLDAAPSGASAKAAQTAIDELTAQATADTEAAAKAEAEARAQAEGLATQQAGEAAEAAAKAAPPPPAPKDEVPVAYDHLRAPSYAPVRTAKPPRIDGVLDDPIWQTAPKETRFLSPESDPYGEPGLDPTVVQVAYDRRALYVAFRCSYEPGRTPPPSVVPLGDEGDLSEMVSVYVDAQHDHSSARVFSVSPVGFRFDFEQWNNGASRNFEWTGIWHSATRLADDGTWTAELAIPWGTAGVRPRGDRFAVGLNFQRLAIPRKALWSLPPPGTPGLRAIPSFFGHLDGITDISPGQLVLLVPYVAVGYHPSTPSYRREDLDLRLRDFDRDRTALRPYAGLYGQVQLGPLRADVMTNPDFSQVSPDAAIARLDRFEPFFPEVRQFFIEAASTFSFGPERYQLFYSRRIGLRQRPFGLYDEVPILFGGATTYRSQGTTVAVLDVLNERVPGPIEYGEDTTVERAHVTVARAQQVFGSSRIGVLAINQTQPFSVSAYRAYGADGAFTFFQDHVTVSGFAARSEKLVLWDVFGAAQDDATAADYRRFKDPAWMLALEWRSREFEASTALLDVGADFNADLGFFEQTGVRRTDARAFYRPQIHNDLIRTLGVGGSVVDVVSHDTDTPLVEKASTHFEASLLDKSSISVVFTRAADTVRSTFDVGGHRLIIRPGAYEGLVTTVAASTAPQRPFTLACSYVDGAYFGGRQRLVTPDLLLRYGPLGFQVTYQHIFIRPGAAAIFPDGPYERTSLQGDRVSGRVLFSPTPDLRLALAVEVNTFDPAAIAQLVASWRISGLTSLVLVANRSGPGVEPWVEDPSDRVLLKLSYGLAVP